MTEITMVVKERGGGELVLTASAFRHPPSPTIIPPNHLWIVQVLHNANVIIQCNGI